MTPHDKHNSVFTDTDLKALLMKSMPLSWQKNDMVKGKFASDNFCPSLLCFVQSQSIKNVEVASKSSFPLATIQSGGG